MSTIRFMASADLLARDNSISKEGGPFGAVVVKGDEIVGRGKSTVDVDHDSTAHAVMNALRDAQRDLGTSDLGGCEVYSTAFPCAMCLSACILAHVDAVHYGSAPADIAAAGYDDTGIAEFVSAARTGTESPDGMPKVDRLHNEITGPTLKAWLDRRAGEKQAEAEQVAAEKRAADEQAARIAEIAERSHFVAEPIEPLPDELIEGFAKFGTANGDVPDDEGEEAPEGDDVPAPVPVKEGKIDLDVDDKFEDSSFFDGPAPEFKMPPLK